MTSPIWWSELKEVRIHHPKMNKDICLRIRHCCHIDCFHNFDAEIIPSQAFYGISRYSALEGALCAYLLIMPCANLQNVDYSDGLLSCQRETEIFKCEYVKSSPFLGPVSTRWVNRSRGSWWKRCPLNPIYPSKLTQWQFSRRDRICDSLDVTLQLHVLDIGRRLWIIDYAYLRLIWQIQNWWE